MPGYKRAVLFGTIVGLGVMLVRQCIVSAQLIAPMKGKAVANVNGETITLEEVDALIKQPMLLQPPTASQVREMRIETLTALIDEKLLRQFLREHGPKIEPSEIDKRWLAIEAMQKEQKKTMEAYLRESSQTEAQVRDRMLTALQLDRYLKDHTTEADLKKYYETYKDYFDKVTVRTSHIVIRLAADAPETERAKAREKLQSIHADIVAGKRKFEDAAKEFSDCPSAPKGGDIGFMFRKWQNVDELYARAAFGMKVGTVSEVVETAYGLHLIKVTDRKEGKPSKYEDCLEEVRDSYSEELRQDLLTQQRKKSKVEITVP